MKIPRILATGVELPRHEAACQWSGGKAMTRFDSTMVEVETDAAHVGYGGGCPLSSFHLSAPAEAVRAGLPGLGPHVPGLSITPKMDVPGNPAAVVE